MRIAERNDIVAIACIVVLIAGLNGLLVAQFSLPAALSLSITSGFALLASLAILLYRKLTRSIYLISQDSSVNLERQFQALVGNVQSLLYLQERIKILSPLPLTGGWAASADFLAFLDNQIRVRKPKLILELGCGVSTIICAQALRANGEGRLVSVDHNADFAKKTEEILSANDLNKNTVIMVCPLTEVRIGDKFFHWYNADKLKLGEELVDLLVVDGPPQVGANSTRYPAVPVLYERLSRKCLIMVDDGRRQAEQIMVEAWAREYNLSPAFVENEKGLFLLTKE